MPPNARNEPLFRDQEFPDNTYRPKPNRHNAPRPAPTTRIRNDPWQSVSALQLGLQPRSFDELHTERMYLLEMLHQCDRRAFDLFGLVPVVEERTRQAENQDDRKQAKKHRGWLRHRIVDIVEEEKKILARLSELHVEIQCRERWSRVEMEREMMWQQQHFGCPSFPTPYLSQMMPYTMPYTQVDAQPVPGYYYPFYEYVEPHNTQHGERNSINEDYAGYEWEQEIPEARQNTPEDHAGSEPFELECKELDATPGDASRSSQRSLEVVLEPTLTKRRSMPSLSRKWSG
ncbi:hypothetical protein F4776DRAFT_601046 [Hypoxylon sp. NC0597]|nr:hypothetical protein F4776DRAFT_601046 [Hypoxylon sp. NC0597]